MIGFDERREGSEIHFARAGSAMVLAGELDIVDMESGKAVPERFEVEAVIDEAQIFFDLRVAGIMPINKSGTVHFLEKEIEVVIQRQFFERLPIFNAEP